MEGGPERLWMVRGDGWTSGEGVGLKIREPPPSWPLRAVVDLGKMGLGLPHETLSQHALLSLPPCPPHSLKLSARLRHAGLPTAAWNPQPLSPTSEVSTQGYTTYTCAYISTCKPLLWDSQRHERASLCLDLGPRGLGSPLGRARRVGLLAAGSTVACCVL